MKKHQIEINTAKLFYKWGKRRALFEVSRAIDNLRRNKEFINDFDMDSEDMEIFEKYLTRFKSENTFSKLRRRKWK